MENNGKLYIVATPIGNLDDMTHRAIATLQEVDLIAAEDTRHSRKLLSHYGVSTSCVTLHEHNEDEQADVFVGRLLQGEDIALISDAGTPLISDPGYRLVSKAHDAGVQVVPIPGASAVIAALSASGLPTDRFYFAGFLPSKQKSRQDALRDIQQVSCTIIFYEACHRIIPSLEDMLEVLGAERIVCLAKELTKSFEAIMQGTVAELLAWLQEDEKRQQGEFVLLVDGYEEEISEQEQQMDKVLEVLLAELPLKQSVNIAVKLTGIQKNKLYDRALILKG